MKLILLLLTFIFPCLLHGQFTLQQRLSESDSISYLPYNNSNAISVIGQMVQAKFSINVRSMEGCHGTLTKD